MTPPDRMPSPRAAGVTALLLLCGLVAGAAAAPCDDAPAQAQRRAQLLAQLESLEHARPFIEQFDAVKRAVDGLHEVLRTTKADVEQTREKIVELLGQAQEQNAQLRNVRRWARAVHSHSEWEPVGSSGGARRTTLEGGLKKSAAWIGELEKDAARFAGMLATLEEGVRARDGRPSEQLEAFRRYFSDIAGAVGKYKSVAPVIGIMVEMFRYFDEAIRLIAVSVRQIEAEYDRRDAILRQLGPQYDNVRYHWPRTTPWERLARQKRETEQQIARIEQHLRDCGIDPDARPLPTEPDERTEIQRARRTAERGCSARLKIRSEDDLLDRRDGALRAMRQHYPRPATVPARYGSELTADEEIDWARQRHQRWQTEYLGRARAETRDAERAAAAVERRFQQYRRGEISLSSAEAGRLNIDRENTRRRLEHLRSRLTQAEESGRRRDHAFASLTGLQAQQQRFKACVRGGVEDLARRRQWDLALVRRTYPDLYSR